jgi:glutaredoxin
VTTTSRVNEIALAKHLRKIGAKLYTAYWCPHCHSQKQRFGKEAVKHLEVIECDRRGVKPQTQLCRDKKIRAYPTWEINGKLYPGNHSLESIANFSQYRGNLSYFSRYLFIPA